MYTFLARQPIFDNQYSVYGYELLYRDGEKSRTANVMDGNSATLVLECAPKRGLNLLAND